jgi:hypothetical protein
MAGVGDVANTGWETTRALFPGDEAADLGEYLTDGWEIVHVFAERYVSEEEAMEMNVNPDYWYVLLKRRTT